jgi:hypothetical protein
MAGEGLVQMPPLAGRFAAWNLAAWLSLVFVLCPLLAVKRPKPRNYEKLSN